VVSRWDWLECYRVWDANRKVFLYPENWLAPNLVPPQRCAASLRRVLAAVRAQSGPRAKRARGVRVWLSGKRGAGALVSAQILASALRRDLYRIDLRSVVSKYIGETEKQLSRAFDAAEKAGAVFFLDEADALFGKRSQVKDSHDRYANIEVNDLLQRMEGYRGLAILATGSRRGFDEAFVERFEFVIRVPPPRRRRRRAP